MLTKADSHSLLQEFRSAIREEISAVRADLSAVEVRVDALETEAQASRSQHRSAEIAATRQGNLLLTLRRQVEDLENRSRLQNIRIRGLPDAVPLQDTVRALFRHILGQECPEDIQFDRISQSTGPSTPGWETQRRAVLSACL
ncbi:contactin-5 [Pelobates cultripes]|uniref:Contactin-5, partial n=1 Tax=Pelobates cultripes TaxID=61616 RepID=A0AAD1VXT0_PELCU|nr:contactin-5 [Pelobates cultripes]